MAEKIDIKTLLENVVLVQKGKVVKVPERDNYAVHPAKGSALALMPGQEVLKQLNAAYPKCVFTWFSKPAKIEGAESAAESKNDKNADGKK